jgi:hypothetical protein
LIKSFDSASNEVSSKCARLVSPGFNGAIEYDAYTDGNPIHSVGVEIINIPNVLLTSMILDNVYGAMPPEPSSAVFKSPLSMQLSSAGGWME